MKRIICILILFSVTAALISAKVHAEVPNGAVEIFLNTINIKINGQKASVNTLLYGDTAYVPLRSIAEKLGKEVTWDAGTNSAGINDKQGSASEVEAAVTQAATSHSSSPGVAQSIAFIFAAALQVTGAIILAQIIFLRNDRDILILTRASSNSGTSALSHRRLLYASWASKIGFGLLLTGFLLGLYGKASGFNIFINITAILPIVFVAWLTSLRICKSLTVSNQPEIDNTSKDTYSYKDFAFKTYDK